MKTVTLTKIASLNGVFNPFAPVLVSKSITGKPLVLDIEYENKDENSEIPVIGKHFLVSSNDNYIRTSRVISVFVNTEDFINSGLDKFVLSGLPLENISEYLKNLKEGDILFSTQNSIYLITK